MTEQELYVLNLALDTQPFVFPSDFKNLKMSPILIDAVKESMIKQGLLKDMNTLTEEGAKITKRIFDYKNSKKYCKIGLVTIAFLDNNTGISMMHYPGGDLDFYRIDTTNFISSIIDAHSFFLSQPGISTKDGITISYDELLSTYKLHHKNSVYIASLCLANEKEAVMTDDVFFYTKYQHYFYNRNKKILYKIIPAQIHEILMERVCA